MKNLIGLAMIAAVLFGAYKLWEVYDQSNTTKKLEGRVDQRQEFGAHLQGMDLRLEQRLREAYGKGALGLAAFLKDYGNTVHLQDPRLAWVELDYAKLLINKDPGQGKKVFQQVQARVPNGSALAAKVKDDAEIWQKVDVR